MVFNSINNLVINYGTGVMCLFIIFHTFTRIWLNAAAYCMRLGRVKCAASGDAASFESVNETACTVPY